jgi:hypothetical protein
MWGQILSFFDKFSYFSIELYIKPHNCRPRMISFGIIGHQTHNSEWKFYKAEITSSQTSFCTNFAIKLSFILSFRFPEHLHHLNIYFHSSYLYNHYNYSRTLCIKCRAGPNKDSEGDFTDNSNITKLLFSLKTNLVMNSFTKWRGQKMLHKTTFFLFLGNTIMNRYLTWGGWEVAWLGWWRGWIGKAWVMPLPKPSLEKVGWVLSSFSYYPIHK